MLLSALRFPQIQLIRHTFTHTHTHTHYMQQANCMYACLNRSGDAAPHSFLSSRWHFTKLDAAVAIRRAWVSTRAFLQNRLMQSAKFKTTLQHFITPKVIQNVCCHHRQSTFFFFFFTFFKILLCFDKCRCKPHFRRRFSAGSEK